MQLLDEIEKARQEYKEGKGVSLKSQLLYGVFDDADELVAPIVI